jgi:hypothetical protein
MKQKRFEVAPTAAPGVSADVLKRVNTKDFPFAVWGPYPPFAFGSVWCIAPDKETANLIASALERLPKSTVDEHNKKQRANAAEQLARLMLGNGIANAEEAKKR